MSLGACCSPRFGLWRQLNVYVVVVFFVVKRTETNHGGSAWPFGEIVQAANRLSWLACDYTNKDALSFYLSIYLSNKHHSSLYYPFSLNSLGRMLRDSHMRYYNKHFSTAPRMADDTIIERGVLNG